jgi:hypothetical protein
MKTALVLVAAATTLSCTLAFVPPAPVVQRQRSAVRYVYMGGGERVLCRRVKGGNERLGRKPRQGDD